MGGPPEIDPEILPSGHGVEIVSNSLLSTKKAPPSYLSADEQDDRTSSAKTLGDFKAFLTILGYARPYHLPLGLGLLCMLLASLCTIGTAKCLGLLIDQGLLAKNQLTTYQWGAAIVSLEIFNLALLWWGRNLLAKYSSLTVLNLRHTLFNYLQKLPMSFYDRQPEGRIVTRITHDVEGMENFFAQNMGRLLNATFMASLAMVAMLTGDFILGGVMVLLTLPVMLFIYCTRHWVRSVNRHMSRSTSALNSRLSEFLSSLPIIRNYGLETWSQEKFQDSVDDSLASHLRANNLYSWSRPLMALMCSFPLIGLVWFGGLKIFAGTMATGLFVSMVGYCERFFTPVMMLAREIHVIQQAFSSTERVASFLTHATEEQVLGEDGQLDLPPEEVRGSIEFKNVWMHYPHPEREAPKWVLQNLSFHIRPGEKVGLIGATGCGKTTTVSLLARLYEYQRGDITLDHHSIRSYQRKFLRQNIGLVSQDAILFSGTLRENLCLAHKIPDESITSACHTTGLAKIMQEKKWGLNSTILGMGSNLSSGEKQLVTLTRTLLANPSLLILDEATSHIDPYIEEVIHRAVGHIMRGRTCLIIAHRLATVKNCDQILVFQKGLLVEHGPLPELLKRKGHFYHMHQAQTG